MQSNQTTTWQDLKCEYFHNLMTLKTSIAVAQNSIMEMNRIYSDVIKKSEKTSNNTMRVFANSWMKKIDINQIQEFPEIKEEHERVLEDPSERKLQDFGFNLQQKLYNSSIAQLSAYQAFNECIL